MPHPARVLASPSARRPHLALASPAGVTALLTILAVLSVAVFLTLGLEGNIAYILPRRITRVSAMVLVGVAVALSTVMFQTVTANRILTPSIMGFDALYLLLQTVVVFVFGASAWLTTDQSVRFLIEVALMVTFSFLLYRWLFTGAVTSLHLMLLVGIVLGTLFRGLASSCNASLTPASTLFCKTCSSLRLTWSIPFSCGFQQHLLPRVQLSHGGCATSSTSWHSAAPTRSTWGSTITAPS